MNYKVRLTSWRESKDRLKPVREQVFIKEQRVPVELEWDGLDEDSLHVIAETDSGEVIGTARMLANGHIGRMSVLAPWRNKGVGGSLLSCLLAEAKRRGLVSVKLSAQTQAIHFYTKRGFIEYGDVFMDAGIPHKWMRLDLSGLTAG